MIFSNAGASCASASSRRFLAAPLAVKNCFNVSACSSAVGSWISNVSGIRGARFAAVAVFRSSVLAVTLPMC